MRPIPYPFLFMATLLVALSLTACGHAQHEHDETHAEEHEHHTDEIIFSPEQATAAGLTTEIIAPRKFTESIKVSGRILPTPHGEATVAATMTGIIDFASGELVDGTSVERGRQLFRISAANIADGNPAAAAVAELEAARSNYERAVSLAEERIISAQELEQAQQRYATARAAAASLGTASQTRTVAASMTGYVKSVLVKPGDYVTMGQPLALITQHHRLQLRAEVPERFYAYLPRISGANFCLAGSTERTVHRLAELNGRLVARGRTVDADGLFVPVVFEFDNVGDIMEGSLAEVYLLTIPRENTLSVPVRALTEEQGIYYVYVKTSNHTYRKAEVRLAGSDGTRVAIAAGLTAGDTVVVNGAIQVKLAAAGKAIPEGHSHAH